MRISKHAREYARKVSATMPYGGATTGNGPSDSYSEEQIAEAFQAGMRFERTMQKATDPAPATGAHTKAPGSE